MLYLTPKPKPVTRKKKETPLDVAYYSLQQARKGTPEAFERLIGLFKENGRTAQELEQAGGA
jgi:hypothetical protein